MVTLWSNRHDLFKVAAQMRGILQSETSGRVSLSTFIGQYLPVLHFPVDMIKPPPSGKINLQKAASHARLTAERLDCPSVKARSVRGEVLRSHLITHGAQNKLGARVKELLGEVIPYSSAEMMAVVQKVDELLD